MLALAESVQVALVGAAGVVISASISAWVTIVTNRERRKDEAANARMDRLEQQLAALNPPPTDADATA